MKTPGYCWYNNDEVANKAIYGALYNWFAVNTGKLCPTGWHVPTNEEWTTLINYLGGLETSGGKLKEFGVTHWNSPNIGATNESGFSSLPGGYRNLSGIFYFLGNYGYWWSSTEVESNYAWYRSLNYNTNKAYSNNLSKMGGFSVRCIRN
jgi:uncharacterized protein (TIGR02145 family)